MNLPQKGYALMAVIFILVILSLAGSYLLKIGAGQMQIMNYDLLSNRAKLATLSAFELLSINSAEFVCQDYTVRFDKEAKALKGFSVNISCLQTVSYPKDNPQFVAWELKAKASYGQFGDRDYVSHELIRWQVKSNKERVANK